MSRDPSVRLNNSSEHAVKSGTQAGDHIRVDKEFGRIAVRSAYRSSEVNGFGAMTLAGKPAASGSCFSRSFLSPQLPLLRNTPAHHGRVGNLASATFNPWSRIYAVFRQTGAIVLGEGL